MKKRLALALALSSALALSVPASPAVASYETPEAKAAASDAAAIARADPVSTCGAMYPTALGRNGSWSAWGTSSPSCIAATR